MDQELEINASYQRRRRCKHLNSIFNKNSITIFCLLELSITRNSIGEIDL